MRQKVKYKSSCCVISSMVKRNWALKQVRKLPLARRVLLSRAKKGRKHVITTVPISKDDLLRKPVYFHTAKRPNDPPEPRSSWAFFMEFPYHDKFLHKYRFRIKSFADVGCALAQGAPGTVASQKVLRPGTLVQGVDIYPYNPEYGKAPFVPLLHNISRAPLSARFTGKIFPKNARTLPRFDVIRFANVASHMTPDEVRASLRNLHASLNEGGFLLGASRSGEFILQKKGAGFLLVADF